MFDSLLESRATTPKRTGGSLVSLALHTAIVGALVAATSRVHRAPDAPPDATTALIFTAPPPATRAAAPRATDASAAPASSTRVPDASPSTVTPSVFAIDVDLPSVTLPTGAGDPVDAFARGARASASGFGSSNGGAPSALGGVFSDREVERAVVLAPGSPTVRYPESLRAAGVEGTVIAEFVVDTSGRVEAGSVRLLIADHETFAAAVRRALPTFRFLPAEAGGRRVRQRVQLPFRFGLDRAPMSPV